METTQASSKRAQTAEERQWSLATHPLRSEIKLLFLAALIVFIITVGIGMLNGQRLIQLSHDVLLTHVHSGTLGWITLSVFATSLIIFGNTSTERSPQLRWLSSIAAIALPAYVLTFFLLALLPPSSVSIGYIARAVFAVPVLLVVIAFFGWIVSRIGKVRVGVTQLAVLGSLVTLMLGALLGLLLQVQFALNVSFLPGGAFGAHPASLVSGYLVLIGMALSEARLRPSISRLGIVQISLLFLAGLVLGIALLLNFQPLFGLNALLVVVGIVLYIIRFAARVVRANWLKRTSTRFFAMSAIFVVVNTALNVYLTVSIVTGRIDADRLPAVAGGVLLALDHSMFIGVMTNALFGLIGEVTGNGRKTWPWVDDILFWGMNIGLVGFLVALIFEMRYLEPIFTPIMGLSILLGIGVSIARLLQRSTSAVASEVQAHS
jgi:hypothetical protein